MADPNNPSADEQQRTYRTIQDIHRTWTSTEKDDRLAASAEEYLADSTYRQSEESGAIRKIDRGLSAAALLSADYHVTGNAAAFDRLSGEEKASVFEEYRETARHLLESETGDYRSLGYDEGTLYRQGYIEYHVKLEQGELERLQAWADSNNPAATPELASVLSDLNTYRGCGFDLTDMAVARTQVAQVLSEQQVTIRKELSQQARDAAGSLAETADGLSDVSKSRIMDTIRSRRLEELEETDTALRQFMGEHPEASAGDWKRAIDYSRKNAGTPVRQSLDKGRKFKDPEPVFSGETITALEDTFRKYGEVTESTGLFRKNAAADVLTFFTGDLAPAINLLDMGGRAGTKAYDIAYRAWLEKSKNAGTRNYRESLAKAREGLRSGNARTRYEAGNRVRDIRRERRFERNQEKRYGRDRTKWDKYSTKTHKKFDDTLKGRTLARLNRSTLGKALGKVFHIKQVLARAVMKAGLFLGKGIAMLLGGMLSVSIQFLPVILIALYATAAFSALFSFLEPEYAQNCINNLNVLDEMYLRAVENEARMKYTKSENGSFTDKSIFPSPDYHTDILLDATRVGQFVNEYGEPVASGNNILPIFMAFRHRTGCELDKDTYVAAAAYGQMMYWRTHMVDTAEGGGEGQAHLDFLMDGCDDYRHKTAGKSTSDNIPYNIYKEGSVEKREYCQEPDKINTNKLICKLEEHSHSDESGCYSITCGLEWHMHTADCYRDDSNDIYSEDGKLLQRVADCGKEPHTHVSSCRTLTCKKPVHTHTDALQATWSTEYGCYTGYNYSCYGIEISCPGHCPGHVQPQYSITVITDIENIVKKDDLVFTPEARNLGWTVNQFFGTLEGKSKDFCRNVSDWWKGLFNTTDLFGLDDFYERYVLDITYGMGKNEASMFRNFTDHGTKAVFYDNASVMPDLISNASLSGSSRNYRYKTGNPGIFRHFGIKNDSENEAYDSRDFPSPFLTDSFEMEGHPVFLNGWGFYPLVTRQQITGSQGTEWVWCVDPAFLTSTTGTYADGYRYAVDAFWGESGLYFSNAAPGADPDTVGNEKIKEILRILDDMARKFPAGFRDEYHAPEAFSYLISSLRGERPSYYPASYWYDLAGDEKAEAGPDTLLCREYIVNTEEGDDTGTWTDSHRKYYYLYVISEADKAGNYGAGEKYYYCLVHDADTGRQFRFVTMSRTDLELYERSYKIR